MEGLDLSHLTVLRFRPRSQEFDDIFLDPDEQYRAFALYGRRALDQITRQCSSTLKHLEVAEPAVESQLDFPANDMIQLPKLESLIAYAAVRLPALANVIHNSKNLKELRIHPYIVIHGTWRPVLRAIRHHPNDIEFSCHIRLLTYHFELDRYVRGADIPDQLESSSYSSDEEHASLVRYLSKRGNWNQHCKAGIGMDLDRELGFESETDGESSDESLEPFENVSDGGSTDLNDFDELF